MKTTKWMLTLLATGLVAVAGCKKSEPVQAWEVHGVKVDLPQLDAAFAGSNEQVQASVAAFKRYFRYGQYAQALVEIDKLGNQPSLTEAQKKLVTNLIEQTKQVVANTLAPAPAR